MNSVSTWRFGNRLFLLLAISSTALHASGCSNPGPPATVSGTITLDGNLVEDTIVIFEPAKGRASVARTDMSGHYELRYNSQLMGAEIGDFTIRLQDGNSADDSGASRTKRLPRSLTDQSQIVKTVVPGKNIIDLDLSSLPQ